MEQNAEKKQLRVEMRWQQRRRIPEQVRKRSELFAPGARGFKLKERLKAQGLVLSSSRAMLSTDKAQVGIAGYSSSQISGCDGECGTGSQPHPHCS